MAAGAEDEGLKEVTKTGEEVVSTSEGEIQLEGGGTAKTSGSSTSKKSQQVNNHFKLNSGKRLTERLDSCNAIIRSALSCSR